MKSTASAVKTNAAAECISQTPYAENTIRETTRHSQATVSVVVDECVPERDGKRSNEDEWRMQHAC